MKILRMLLIIACIFVAISVFVIAMNVAAKPKQEDVNAALTEIVEQYEFENYVYVVNEAHRHNDTGLYIITIYTYKDGLYKQEWLCKVTNDDVDTELLFEYVNSNY